MSSEYDILVDSDAWVGLYSSQDPHHKNATALFERIKTANTAIVTTSAVEGEVATVLSHKLGQEAARLFLTELSDTTVPIIHIDEKLHQRALEWFADQATRGTSYVDCTNIAVAELHNIPRIFSFDKFYSKKTTLQPLV